MATVFEVRDEIREVVEPMIPSVKVPERQGRRPVVGRVCFDTSVRRSLSRGAREFLVPSRTACEVGFLLRLVPGVPGFGS